MSCFQKHYWHHINHHLCRISEKFSCPTFKCLCMLGQSRQTNMRCCQLQSTVSPEDDGQMSLVLSNLKKVDIDGCITSSRICNLRNTKEAQQSLWKVGGGGQSCPATCWSYSVLVMVGFSLKARCLCSEYLTRLSKHNHSTASIYDFIVLTEIH